MPRDPQLIPLPPAQAPPRLPPLEGQPLTESWRIHRELNPLKIPPHPRGKFRFDAPAGEFAVTYLNLDRYGCYAEVFGDGGEIPPSAARRRLSMVRSRRLLRLVALDRARVQKAYGLDLRICSSLDYRRTQAWSRAWHQWHPQADGIRYPGRHAVENPNLCLFLDRCGDALEVEFEGFLRDLRRDGLIASHRYNLAPRLFFE